MQKFVKLVAVFFLILLATDKAEAQAVPDTAFKPGGKLWGYAFGDYYYKAHSDPSNRGGANQYTGIEEGRNAFQFRRIYLGYNYDISPKFSAEMLLAAEDNVATSTGATSGDLLTDNKLTYYIKLANLRWKNIWKGTDLVIGQSATPAFPLLTESIWGYRSIERTVADIRRTPSFDLGVSLQGKFDSKGNYGYNVMVGNGTSAKPENDKFKWFYGDVFAKFFNQKLVFDLYADYERLPGSINYHHSRNMVKGFVAYTTPAFTVGVEAFINRGQNDVVGLNTTAKDTLSANAKAVSVYVKGRITKDKLGFFARVDSYNPDSKYDNNLYTSYKGITGNYEPNNKEMFMTAGLDFTPMKNVHFMPNVWYNRYTAQQSNLSGPANRDHDLVFRLTFYYIYR
ncbi:MAG TPA: hypothetical protein VGO09_01465 [Flavisolibacter sp.]|nr:hypothetical protein [Flavisolibacter sp.]